MPEHGDVSPALQNAGAVGPTCYGAPLLTDSYGWVCCPRRQENTEKLYFDLKTSPTAAVAGRRGAAAHEAAAELPSVGQRTSPRTYSTRRVQRLPDQALLDLLERQGVEFGSSVASFSSMASRGLLTVFALWLPLVPLFLVMRRITGARLLRTRRVSCV